MSPSLVVVLGDEIVGTISRAHGRHTFEYREEYVRAGHVTPLSLSMPPAVRSHPEGAITPWLWGLLPENPQVLSRWAREFHASSGSAFSLLSTRIGRDCPGAVRLLPPDEIDQVGQRGEVAWISEADVAQRLRDLKTDATSWLGRSFTGQFSLAGAQAKTALAYDGSRWGVPSGAAPTTHILKPAVRGLDDHDLNEHLCLDAARRAGLLAAKTWVARFEDQSAIVVERYDRQRIGDRLTRIHQEDLCQALGVHPSRKYQDEGGPGPKRAVALLRTNLASADADDAIWSFVDALIWNWLIAGTDAHAKNYSLLLDGDDVRLAPLYDVASALPYGEDERELRFAMKLGHDYSVFPRSDPWRELAADLQLDAGQVVDRVRSLAVAAPQAFAEAAGSAEVTELRRPLPSRLAGLVADRVGRCLQVMGLR